MADHHHNMQITVEGTANQGQQQVEGVCAGQGEQKVCNLFVVYTLLIRSC